VELKLFDGQSKLHGEVVKIVQLLSPF